MPGTPRVACTSIGLGRAVFSDEETSLGEMMEFHSDKLFSKRVLIESFVSNENLTVSDARKQGALDDGRTTLLEFAGAQCEKVDILRDFGYVKMSDYLSHLGIHSFKAEGKIQDVSVTSHPDEGHLNEHTDRHTADRFRLHRNYPSPFRRSTRIRCTVPSNSMVHQERTTFLNSA
jgi:hypothetical protein